MRAFKISALAVAALSLASVATPSFAGSPYYDEMGAPMSNDQAEMTMQERMDPAVVYGDRRMGQFTCSPNERRTRLERQACGSTKRVY